MSLLLSKGNKPGLKAMAQYSVNSLGQVAIQVCKEE